ncbi:hypothetical protein C922_01382 [Plasmodium inui San Antonio 1]|uniref:MerC domain-containing protein n=1 Tax=Plasmodium inui San Antonio 1 TaxID=1237626 RepID=W7A5F8_9APIC|nr:hypothetical protein C922_01382 [Plasmodium inui San Antonio 1]EUD68362.1 hypothetical protein C922_01382 [Plasmodium inui San Antonio 1]
MKNRLKRTYVYIKSNLNKLSSIASIICLIDCTLIPLITVLISIFSVVHDSENGEAEAGTHNHSHHHGWQETVALYLMTPIISFTTIYNFIQLKNFSLFIFTLVGITMFVLSHAHIEFRDQNITNRLKQAHIPMSILAAIILISTNYIAHQLLKSKNLDPCCTHKKITNHLDDQSWKQHHPHHHDHHRDLEMNEDNYNMHNHTSNNDNVANHEKYYNIRFQQHNNDHELVRFL